MSEHTEQREHAPERQGTTQEQKTERKTERKAEAFGRARMVLEVLGQRFPAVFHPTQPLPLKIGVRKDIEQLLAPEYSWSKTQLRQAIDHALQQHTTQPAYRQALASGGPRYSLQGEMAGEVSADHQAKAYLPRRASVAKRQPHQVQPDSRQMQKRQNSQPRPTPSAPNTAHVQGRRPHSTLSTSPKNRGNRQINTSPVQTVIRRQIDQPTPTGKSSSSSTAKPTQVVVIRRRKPQ